MSSMVLAIMIPPSLWLFTNVSCKTMMSAHDVSIAASSGRRRNAFGFHFGVGGSDPSSDRSDNFEMNPFVLLLGESVGRGSGGIGIEDIPKGEPVSEQ